MKEIKVDLLCEIVISKPRLKKLPRASYGGACLLTEMFCAVYKYTGKADLGKGYWNPKEIIKL